MEVTTMQSELIPSSALKDNQTIRTVILPDESRKQFCLFTESLYSELDPQTQTEAVLADRGILLMWRLRRTGRIEAGLLSEKMEEKHYNGTITYRTISEAFENDCRNRQCFEKLGRYERGLERSLYTALEKLHELQKGRKKVINVTPG
ncbi:MAG: hypothetical protein WCQ99_12010 [Pseudomonadota bacterium]